LRDRYKVASRSEKTRILDEFVALAGYHRKHVVRLMADPKQSTTTGTKPGRKVYDEAVKEAAIVVWEAADRICAKRLKVILPELVRALENHGHFSLDVEVRRKLLAASAATLDRLLSPVRATASGRARRRQAAPTAIKRQVRVRTFADWGEVEPGFFEHELCAANPYV